MEMLFLFVILFFSHWIHTVSALHQMGFHPSSRLLLRSSQHGDLLEHVVYTRLRDLALFLREDPYWRYVGRAMIGGVAMSMLLFGAFLWSSTSKKWNKNRAAGLPQPKAQVEVGSAMEQDFVETVQLPPPLVLHSFEAACLDELIFDPEADYAQVLEFTPECIDFDALSHVQVLAEARSYATKQAAAAAQNGGFGHSSSTTHQPRCKNSKPCSSRERTAKVYFVPATLHALEEKKPSWKESLLFWRKPKRTHQQQQQQHQHASSSKPRSKRGSASGPLYTDGIPHAPSHRPGKPLSGPLKLSSAMSCRREDAESPYVPLHRPSFPRMPSGPLYVS